jgi:three-Cys-motif partner protein
MAPARAKTFFKRVRNWQWIKHSIFSQYLLVWAMKVGSSPQAKTIWVIDAFAGTGEFIDEETGEKSDGSPVRAALIAKRYNDTPKKIAEGKQLRLICIERDSGHFEALQERMSEFDFVEVLSGEFKDHADEIARKLGRDRALVLLDPIGVKALDAETCRKLFNRPGKTDALVNVQFGVVHRTRGQLLPNGEPNPAVLSAAKTVEALDEFFGTDEWRKRIAINGETHKEQEEEYLQLYYDSVVGRGLRCKHHYPVSGTFGGKTKYYLVNIADHADAEWLFNDLCAAVESRLYVSSCERENPSALTGFYKDENNQRIEVLRRKLGRAMIEQLGQQPGNAMPFDELRLAVRDGFFGKLKQGDYDKAVKQLYKDGAVEREQKGVRPVLKPREQITLKSQHLGVRDRPHGC